MNETGEVPWGDRLRSRRQASGLTLRQVADATGFSVSHLSNVERGARAAGDHIVRVYENLADAAEAWVAAEPSQVAQTSSASPVSSVPLPSDDFGTWLLRLRLSRGLSLFELSAATHVSKSYLGNLERGRKHPSAAVAAACDRQLAAGGSLVVLASVPSRPALSRGPIPAPSEVDVEDADVDICTYACDPDSVLAAGESALLALRHAAQHVRPRTLAQALAFRSRSIARAASRCGGARSKHLWLLAARCAEFTGWLAEEAGETVVSRAWTDAAAVWAVAGGDVDMAGYRWERLALTAFYRGDCDETVALAQRGLTERGISPRIRGLAMRRLAQGYALAGDRRACERALAEAVGLLERGPAPYPHGSSWGPNSIDDDSEVIRASCLVDLGACRAAVSILGSDPEGWAPRGAPRTRTRFIVRGALAFAGAGELDFACRLTESALPDVHRIDSETVRVDIRALTGILLRHPSHQRSRELLPDLISAIRVH